MPTTEQHDELATAHDEAHRAYEQLRDADERESSWARSVADELAIVATNHGLTLPDALARALDSYRAQQAVTAPLRTRWRECSDRAGRLYTAMYPADRLLSVAGDGVVPLVQ